MKSKSKGRFRSHRRLPPQSAPPPAPRARPREWTWSSRRGRRGRPTLRFSPYAWAKWQCLRDLGDTEIACFGISSEHDPLLVIDLAMVKQKATAVSVGFDDEAVADYFEQKLDDGLAVERYFRIWLHTHPGHSAEPSGVDEQTFSRVFGDCHWSVMGILARGGQSYARLRFGVGPGGHGRIPIDADYSRPFPAADPAAWEAEYRRCVQCVPDLVGFDPLWLDDPDWLGQFAIDDEALMLVEQTRCGESNVKGGAGGEAE